MLIQKTLKWIFKKHILQCSYYFNAFCTSITICVINIKDSLTAHSLLPFAIVLSALQYDRPFSNNLNTFTS